MLCTTGAASHTLAGVLASQPDVELSVFTQSQAKAQAWQEIQRTDQLTIWKRDGCGEQVAFKAGHFTVTPDPAQAARGCDILIVSLPAFLHFRYLSALAPHLEEGCVVVGLPGQCGFELDVRHALGTNLQHFRILSFDSLPWVCRLIDFGRHALITGTKETLAGAVQGDDTGARVADPLCALQRLLGSPPILSLSGHLLGITLRAPNASNHPAMMYSRWAGWDGTPLASAPLFYEELDQPAAALLWDVNGEIRAIAHAITAAHPEADLSQVVPAYDWEIACYGPAIADKTDLMTAVRTNAAYAGIPHPMTEVERGRFVPDYGHRFMTEDVPYGLVVLRGIAEIAGVATPSIDRVLRWSQQVLGKEYLTPAGLAGRDLGETRSPQRYGLGEVADLLRC